MKDVVENLLSEDSGVLGLVLCHDQTAPLAKALLNDNEYQGRLHRSSSQTWDIVAPVWNDGDASVSAAKGSRIARPITPHKPAKEFRSVPVKETPNIEDINSVWNEFGLKDINSSYFIVVELAKDEVQTYAAKLAGDDSALQELADWVALSSEALLDRVKSDQDQFSVVRAVIRRKQFERIMRSVGRFVTSFAAMVTAELIK